MSDPDVVLELPAALRSELKAPMGPVYDDTAAAIAAAGRPMIAVGDIVTYHLREASHTPDVALIDGRTKRESVADHVEDAIAGFNRRVAVANPPGTLTAGLLDRLRESVAAFRSTNGGVASARSESPSERSESDATLIVVDGEEDLAVLPALLVAPAGASVVYGQPDEGMVVVTVDEETQATARDLLDRMDGDSDRATALLGLIG